LAQWHVSAVYWLQRSVVLIHSQQGVEGLSDYLQDYATTRVPEDRTIGGLRIGMINGVLVFAVPGLVAGVQIGGALGLERGIRAFLIGGLFLSVVGTVVGIIGVRNRVSSYVLTQFVFGRMGANILNLAIAVALLGWYGVNMDLLSATLQHLGEQLFGYRPTGWLVEIAAGVLMTITAIYGFQLLEKLSSFIVPILFLLTAYLGIKSFYAFDGDLQRVVEGSYLMTDGEAVTAIVGGFIVSAVLMSDFTRFARKDTDAAIAAFLPFLLLSCVAYLAAAIAAIVLQESDVLVILLTMGLGVGALGLVFLSTWITNVVNLYSCSLSLASVVRGRKQWHLTIVAGVFATLAAMLNILENYTSFLFGLSIIFAPIGGIFIVDFYLLRARQPYPLESLESDKATRIVALVAWGTGTGVAVLSSQGVLTLTGFEVADALLSAMLAYSVMAWRTPANRRRNIDISDG